MSLFKNIIESVNSLRDLIYLRKLEVSRKKELKKYCSENKVKIYENVQLNNTTIGEYSYVAENTILSNCKIGKFCSIGPNSIMGYGDHPVNFISTSPVFFLSEKIAHDSFTSKDYFESRNKITIGNDVWVGAQVYIKNGVNIGNGAIIAAGAVVTSDVPDYAIVGGVPAKVIKYRFDEDTIKQLSKLKWWDWTEEKLRKSHSQFISSDIKNALNELNNTR